MGFSGPISGEHFLSITKTSLEKWCGYFTFTFLGRLYLLFEPPVDVNIHVNMRNPLEDRKKIGTFIPNDLKWMAPHVLDLVGLFLIGVLDEYLEILQCHLKIFRTRK